ncbi:hypothetical protein [Macrococcus equipercicus]|uniref:Uncharacterized protein n=1 Tax=Macrococcus equipercicus TaxID=69967 RepID=A0A9Q9BKS6_9STAP|nr:hypothetical protein [Macrococcus equipercicus]UTH13010.1 hypothetical protein KFV11_06930 [Macrococcus equipercicus]
MDTLRDAQGRFKHGNTFSKGNRGNTNSASKIGNGNRLRYGTAPELKAYKAQRPNKYLVETYKGFHIIDDDVCVMDQTGQLYVRKDVLLMIMRNKKRITWKRKRDILQELNDAEVITRRTL